MVYRGLSVRSRGNVLRLMPSLTIPRKYLFSAVDRLFEELAEIPRPPRR